MTKLRSHEVYCIFTIEQYLLPVIDDVVPAWRASTVDPGCLPWVSHRLENNCRNLRAHSGGMSLWNLMTVYWDDSSRFVHYAMSVCLFATYNLVRELSVLQLATGRAVKPRGVRRPAKASGETARRTGQGWSGKAGKYASDEAARRTGCRWSGRPSLCQCQGGAPCPLAV